MSPTKKHQPFMTLEQFYKSNRYVFFGKQAGNMSLLAPRNRDEALNNRQAALENITLDSDTNLAILKQTHSADVLTITKDTLLPLNETIEGDALVTKEKNIVLGVLTADCAPVLFYGHDRKQNTIIGAAHAGWGGALKGVLENTIETMRELGAELNSIQAAIGPCIAQQSYEVHEEFIAPFLNDDPMSIQFFTPSSLQSDKLYFDLKAYCAYRLKNASLKDDNIFISSIDTYTEQNSYFSHRRATHENNADIEGRHISIITI